MIQWLFAAIDGSAALRYAQSIQTRSYHGILQGGKVPAGVIRQQPQHPFQLFESYLVTYSVVDGQTATRATPGRGQVKRPAILHIWPETNN